MDEETRAALQEIRENLYELTEYTDAISEALGQSLEAQTAQQIKLDRLETKLSQLGRRVNVVGEQTEFFRRTLQEQINAIAEDVRQLKNH